MSDECKILDPTAFGLFFVAIVSLPLAISGIGGFADSAVCSQLLMGIAALANFVLTLYRRLPWPTRSSPATDAKASLAELKPFPFPIFKIIIICRVMTRSS